jgi:hypothetical protein
MGFNPYDEKMKKWRYLVHFIPEDHLSGLYQLDKKIMLKIEKSVWIKKPAMT